MAEASKFLAPHERRIYTVKSRKPVELLASDLLVDGELSINAAVEEKGYFSVHFKGTKLHLVAGGYCGLIPINPNVSIDVQPKMPVSNLSRVFGIALLPVKRIVGAERAYDAVGTATPPILRFLAEEFLRQLEHIVEAGLHKSFQERRESTTRPRGRILVGRTLSESWARGHKNRVSTTYYQQDIDTPENRVLKAAALLLMSKLAETRVSRDLRSLLGEKLAYFSGVSSLRKTDLSSRSVVHDSLARYSSAIRIAVMLLREREIKIDKYGNEIDLGAVVVNFDDLFEDYVRNSLILEQKRRGALLSVGKGKKRLFDRQKKPVAEPDVIVCYNDGSVAAIAEVKYKSWPNRADINQAITYGYSFRVPFVFLIHQAEEPEAQGLEEIGSIDGLTLFRFGLDLSVKNLAGEEEELAGEIFSRLTSSPTPVSSEPEA